MDDRIDDPTAAFGPMLAHFGFTDVNIAEVRLPDYARAWFASSEDEFEPEELEAICQEVQYFRVTTRQGQFGILIALYPVLDITGTGVTIQDLVPEQADLPPDLCFIGLGEEAVVFRFVQKLQQLQLDRLQQPNRG